MIVGIDGRYLQDRFHGIGRYTYGLLRGLLSSVGDHRIVLFADDSLPNHRFPWQTLDSESLRIVPVDFPLYSPVELWQWPALAAKHRLDLFHSPYVWSPWFLPCPLVVTVHDMIFERFPNYIPGRRYILPYQLASAHVFRRADALIAVSASTRSDLLAYRKPRPERVFVTLEGGDPAFHNGIAPAQANNVRAKYDLPERYILAVGVRRPHKNIDRFLTAFARIAGVVPQSAVLVGGADKRFPDTARSSIDSLTSAGRLREVPHVDEEDLPAVYALADLLVQPSIIEGFGLPVLEAMQCGCPVICARSSSLPEVAGDAALMFDPYSVEDITATLSKTLGDDSLRSRLACEGLRQARLFTWERTAAATLTAYQAVLGGIS